VSALGVTPDAVLRAAGDEAGARALLARLSDVVGLAMADEATPL
jgi:hypothetical protein